MRWNLAGFFLRTPVIWLGALVLGGAVGGTLALTNPAMFSATGLLLGVGADSVAARDEAALIGSDEVARAVLAQVGAGRLAPGCAGSAPCAIDDLKSRLQVSLTGDPDGFSSSPMLRLTATHADPAIAIAMVDAAVAVDRMIWRVTHPADRAAALEPQLTAAQITMDGIAAEMARVRAQAHLTALPQDLARAAAEGAVIARQDNDLRLRQAQAAAELQTARTALQTTPATVLDSRETSSGDPGQESRALLLQLKLQRAHMAQLYARDYPGLAEIDAKITIIESAMKIQAQNPSSVVRDIRNPMLALLTARVASLEAEISGLGPQRQELRRQAGIAADREAGLRTAEAQLAAFEQRASAQQAVVQQLALQVADMRAQDSLTVARLTQRRLLQRPEAAAIPWTGSGASALAGGLAGLAYGAVMTLIARRRRSFYRVIQVSRRAFERLERAWMTPLPGPHGGAGAVANAAAAPDAALAASPVVLALPVAPPQTMPAAPPPVAEGLDLVLNLRMFALHRRDGIKTLGFDAQGAAGAHPAP